MTVVKVRQAGRYWDVTMTNGTRWLVTKDGDWQVHPALLKRWRVVGVPTPTKG